MADSDDSRTAWCEDMDFWALTPRQRQHYLGRLSRYHSQLAEMHGARAQMYGRKAQRWLLIAATFQAVAATALIVRVIL